MEYRFIQYLARKGIRIFTSEQAKQFAKELEMNPETIVSKLQRLAKKEVVERLMKGLYCLGPEFLSGIPIHEYEIGVALASPGAIAYLPAYSYHHLTDQISSVIYVLSIHDPLKSYSKNSYHIRGIHYKIIRTQPENFFGIEKRWIGQVAVQVTDLERTLLDGLSKPKYCGDFREVLHAYSQSIDRLDLDKIIVYALRNNESIQRRLGWVLSHLKVDTARLTSLTKPTSSSFAKLDPSGPSRGPWNHEWLLQENL